MNILLGSVLGGTAILVIFLYMVKISLLSLEIYRGNIKSDSRGIKNLRYQEWNRAWQRFVTRR